MATPWSGYLDDVSAKFDTGVDNLQTQVTEALDKLAAKPSDPALLAAYQSKLSEYNLYRNAQSNTVKVFGFAPIFPDICYHLTHYKPAAADIPVASDNPAHYADAIRYNARTPLQGSLLPLTRLVWA